MIFSNYAMINLPIRGTASEVAGTSSAISSMNMENARNTDSPRVTYTVKKQKKMMERNAIVNKRHIILY
jgi:hypothetical protein